MKTITRESIEAARKRLADIDVLVSQFESQFYAEQKELRGHEELARSRVEAIIRLCRPVTDKPPSNSYYGWKPRQIKFSGNTVVYIYSTWYDSGEGVSHSDKLFSIQFPIAWLALKNEEVLEQLQEHQSKKKDILAAKSEEQRRVREEKQKESELKLLAELRNKYPDAKENEK